MLSSRTVALKTATNANLGRQQLPTDNALDIRVYGNFSGIGCSGRPSSDNGARLELPQGYGACGLGLRIVWELGFLG